ncbi:MAG: M50 family metallopeptidase [Bacteroidales bacterium]|nr:M50 family metallopeptidase [Bacteroidales bacterium]
MDKIFLIATPVFVILFIRMKYFKTVLRPLNTIIHEFSHAFVALLLGEKIKELKINSDASGSCTTSIKSKKKSFFIALAGYTLPSVLAYFIIYRLQNDYTVLAYYVLIAICLLAVVLYIRNSFGVFWILAFTFLNILLIYVPFLSAFQKEVLYIYACILLTENTFSVFELLYINLGSAKKSGDSYNLQKITHIPALVFTLLFLAFALFMVYKSVLLLM